MNYRYYKKTASIRLNERMNNNKQLLSSFKEGKISLKEFNKEFHCERFGMRVDFSGLCNPTSQGVGFAKLMRVDGNYHYVATNDNYYGYSIVTTYKICYYTLKGIITASYCYDGLKLRGNIEDIYDVEGMKLQWNNSTDYGKKKLKNLWSLIFHYRTPFININDFINSLEHNS